MDEAVKREDDLIVLSTLSDDLKFAKEEIGDLDDELHEAEVERGKLVARIRELKELRAIVLRKHDAIVRAIDAIASHARDAAPVEPAAPDAPAT